MFDIGGGELLLILLVVLLLFGPRKLPEVAQLIGKGVQKVRRAQEDLVEQVRQINSTVAEQVEPIIREATQLNETIARPLERTQLPPTSPSDEEQHT